MDTRQMIVIFSSLVLTQMTLGNIDEFDCVDIYKQPAFQHPLLKHHKIPEKFTSNESFDRKSKYKTTDQSCPKGTVAILRQRSETESLHLDTDDHFGHHFAVMDTYPDASIYRGAQADISIHNLTLQNNQLSRSQIWLENGPPGELNSIQVGWAVHPRVYGDSATRFTIYWTADGYKTTGCYNTNCPGFIIVTRNPSIGNIFKLSSVYGGDKTVIFTPHVYQDVFTPGWALKVDDEMIGYWPGELFTHLKNGASRVRFGGNTYISPDGISPPMGNGHFPLKDYQRSSSFLHVKLTNHRYQTIEAKTILRNADSRCFRLMDRRYTKENGKSFSYGGAGGRCGI
ncbi:BnaAnng13170D [Brassica napus]|uniref:BnaAnng13170D protein n=1 Tax=Brassica napus TaxID=3708 RepID=A0A078IZ79_BRANA|nr:BnaAnng13170D [Brassica napus]